MLKASLRNFALSVFSFGVLCLAQASAQEVPCSLRLDVLEFDGDGVTIKDAEISLKNTETKTAIKPSLPTDLLLFGNLSSGRYKIEISRSGFQRRVKEIEVDCALADATGTILEIVYLWKGDSKKTVNFGSNVVGSGKEGDEHAVRGVKEEESTVNNSAIKLGKPSYPAAAKSVRASGVVNVQVTIDEDGNVISAHAVEGHPLLRMTAVKAARTSKFKPTLLEGKPVKVTGIITYNFVAK